MEEVQTILPVTKVKRQLLDILKRMEEDQSIIGLTRNGEPVAIMMTVNRYESLLETIEILADARVMAALARSHQDFNEGKVYAEEQVWE